MSNRRKISPISPTRSSSTQGKRNSPSSSKKASASPASKNHSNISSQASTSAASRQSGKVFTLKKADVPPLDRHGSVSPLAPKSSGVKKGKSDQTGRKNRLSVTVGNGVVYNASQERLNSLRPARRVNYNVDQELQRQLHNTTKTGVQRRPAKRAPPKKKAVAAADAKLKSEPKARLAKGTEKSAVKSAPKKSAKDPPKKVTKSKARVIKSSTGKAPKAKKNAKDKTGTKTQKGKKK